MRTTKDGALRETTTAP